jgi:CRP-like cAMP-binding protein
MDIADKMRRQRVHAGAVIVRQGEPGDDFYVIRSGAVELYREEPGAQRMTTTLKEGEFFGQAALAGESRDATVIAATETELYVLALSDFEAAVQSSASFNEIMLRAIFQRQ